MATRKTIYFSQAAEDDLAEVLLILREKYAPLKISASQAVAMALAEYSQTLLTERSSDD